jgi:ankyrin repeat protein
VGNNNNDEYSTDQPNLEKLLKKIESLPEFENTNINDINKKGIFGNTPLHIAVIWGDIDSVSVLINAGADLNMRGEHGYTALHDAVEQGHYDIARLLIQRGCALDIANDDGLTPSQLATLLGDKRISQLFHL